VRLGTFDVNGTPICQAWPARVFALAEHRGVPRRRVEAEFPYNCRFANLAMMLDAITDQTDALLNRVFGQLETDLHKALRALAPSSVAAEVAGLQAELDMLNRRWPRVATKALRHFARARLAEIQRDPGRDLRQEPIGWDGSPPMFDSESKILNAVIAEIEDPAGELWQALQAVEANAKNDTAAEIEDAVKARTEVAGA
jgi:hypothetical protein